MLSCHAEMESAYYSGSRPATLVPTRSEWPEVCVHYGSKSDVACDTGMVAADKWLHVYPQCGGCRVKSVKVKHSQLEKQCAAASGRKRHRDDEELLQQRRVQERHVAPARNAGEDTIAGVVGKKKQDNLKFILWESDVGSELCDQCTWQPGEFDFVPSVQPSGWAKQHIVVLSRSSTSLSPRCITSSSNQGGTQTGG